MIGLALAEMELGRIDDARALHERALAYLQTHGGPEHMVAAQLDRLANIIWEQGDREEAQRLHEEALALRRRIGHGWGLAWSLVHLGHLALERGDEAGARACFAECLAAAQEAQTTVHYVHALEGFALLAVRSRDLRRAQTLRAAATRLRDTHGIVAERVQRPRLAALQAAIEQGLDPAVAAAAWEAGQALSRDDAVAYALEAKTTAPLSSTTP